jgi:hypothetical protein
MTDRVIEKWQRVALPPRGEGKGSLLLSVSFPTAHLSSDVAVPTKPVIWIAPSGIDRSKIVQLLLTNETVEAATALLKDGSVLASHIIPHGETLILFAFDSDWVGHDLVMPAGFHEPDDFVFPADTQSMTTRPIRLTIFRPVRDGDGDCLNCEELGGYRLPAGEASVRFPDAHRLSRNLVLDHRGNSLGLPPATSALPGSAKSR